MSSPGFLHYDRLSASNVSPSSAFVTRQNISRPEGSGWETGRPSVPGFMDMNIHATRCPDKEPRAVVWQYDEENPLNPCSLLMAYAEKRVRRTDIEICCHRPPHTHNPRSPLLFAVVFPFCRAISLIRILVIRPPLIPSFHPNFTLPIHTPGAAGGSRLRRIPRRQPRHGL